LGLTTHPKVIEAAKKALDTWGTSTTGSRLSNGSRRCHEELEEYLAHFLCKEACHVHSAGYLSCMASIATFAQSDDVIFSDKQNHSSLWSGMLLTRARVERFAHNDPNDLRQALSFEKEDSPKFLILEGIYSMEGHIARLPEFVDVIKNQNCLLILDDAHGLGVMGAQGRGVANHFGLESAVDVLAGSLSKSLASGGGFVAGSRDVIDYLRSHSKQTIFSAAISPPQAAAALAVLKILQEEPEHLERLWANTRRYKQILDSLALDTWGSQAPAVPIVLKTKVRAYIFWKALMEKGVFTVISLPPAVPPGKDLVRTAISARHTPEDFEKIADALAYAVKQTS
ncbi:MAG: aminotransferase class I/II-fold pyridoxal phosphate-dependent enzyme, partial [Chlamydiales bacterium]